MSPTGHGVEQEGSETPGTLPPVPACALILLAAILITAALYARSLRLPFYSDDLVQLTWLRDLSSGELWGQISPYGYYRPLAFSLWMIWRSVGLPLTPAGLRLLNLASHALAAALVGWLAASFDRGSRPLSGVLAAAFFAAFPFAYQVVPWVSAVFYPLVVILSVAAVLAYRRFRQARIAADGTGHVPALFFLVLSIAAAGLAPFAHENGMLAGALVALAELVDRPQLRGENKSRFPSPWPLAHVGLNVLFLIVWFRLRAGGVSTLDLSVGGLSHNATILVMGLSFPLAPLATPLAGIGLSSQAGVWIVTLATVGLLIPLTRRAWRAAVFGAGWFVLSTIPVLVTMRPEWLIDAPRFLYPAAVGAALWWGVALAPRLPPGEWAGRKSLTAAGIRILLALIALAPAARFVHEGIAWHLRGGQAIWDAVEAAEENPGEPLLLVNLPNRLAPERSTYLYFDGSAVLLPPQVPAGEIVGAHLGVARPDDTAATVGVILPPGGYVRETYGDLASGEALIKPVEAGLRVYVADYSTNPIRLRFAGRRITDYRLPEGSVAYFGDFIALWEAESLVEGHTLCLTLRWELIHALEGAPTVFVHVVDDTGQIAAQGDGDPLAGLYPMSANHDHIIVEDVRHIPLPGGGLYTVYVGVWDPATGQRLPTRGGDYPENAVPVAHISD